MRIALIADTHGVLDARIADAVRGADWLVHAGDVGAGIETELAALADNVVIAQGNNDPADSGWPESRQLSLPGGELAIAHGHQWPARTRHQGLRERFADAAAIVCGHSHRRLIDDAQVPWILNPGAAGRTRAYGGPGYIELIAESERWWVRVHDYATAGPRQKRA